MTQTTRNSAKPAIELMPPSILMRVGRRRLTLTWRPRLRLPSLLSGLLQRSWKRVLAPTLKVSIAAAAVCGAWQMPALAAAPAAGTLPTGWSVVNGSITFTQNGNTLNINQLSPQAIANFVSFSIGSDATVNVNQPSSLAALLARVTGGDISQIYGKLTAPGTVVLYNPNGLVIGPGGMVDVGRFVGTTLNISDSDFLAGKFNFVKQGTAGAVDNQGTIQSATGGSVYLVGSSVSNSGVIKSAGGEVILGAGDTVTLADTATPGVTVKVTGGAGSVTNLGTITADAGRIGVAAGLINNSGVISASSVVKEGGRIFLRASQKLTTAATSSITADGTVGGNVTLYSDGAAYIDGNVSATGAAGHGGFVETSGLKQLDVVKAPTVGSGGTWYIDPYNLEVVSTNNIADDIANAGNVITSIGETSRISNGTINQMLNANQSVVLATGGDTGTGGNITVNADITNNFGYGTTLTLKADANININANITSNVTLPMGLVLTTNYRDRNAGKFEVKVGPFATIRTGGDVLISNGATGNANGTLNLTNNATLDVGSGSLKVGSIDMSTDANLTLGSGASLVATSLSTLSGASVTAINASLVQIGTLSNIGNVTLSGVSNATVGNVDNQGRLTLRDTNFTVSTAFENNYNGTLTTGGVTNITLNGNLTNHDGANIGFGGADQSSGTTNVTGSGTLVADGGYVVVAATSGYASEGGGAGANNSGYAHTLNMTNSGGLKLVDSGILVLNSDQATTRLNKLVVQAGSIESRGGVVVNDGSLSVSGSTLIDSGKLEISGGNTTFSGTTNITGSGSVRLTGGNLTANGTAVIDGSVNMQNASNLTLNANTSGSGSIRLTGSDEGGGGEGFNSLAVTTPSGPTLVLGNVSSTMDIDISNATMQLNGSVRLNGLSLSGAATVNGAAGSRLNVSESFSQSGGTMTLADAALSSNSCGTLYVGNITANNLVIDSQSGSISQNSGTSLHVKTQLIAKAVTGINLAGVEGNQIAAFAANNSGTGDIKLVNSLNSSDTSAVILNGVSTATGNITIDNTGALQTAAIGSNADFLGALPTANTNTAATKLAMLGINTTGQIKTVNGNVSVATHSPLTIGSGGVSAGGNIGLTAGAANDPTSNLITNGVLSGANINLTAGNNLTVNANVVATGAYTPSAPTGSVSYGAGVSYTQLGNAAVIPNPAPATTTNSGSNTNVTTQAQSQQVQSQQAQSQQAQSQQAQSQQAQNLQSTVNITQLGSGSKSISDVQQSGGSSQSSGSGSFGEAGDGKSPKKLPMCT
ncbi:beta strand repeat-containing protein [Herbaspirillum sp. alder98]|uniref:beta strand repeat-containing protein n=1 Tax=Herbaspirillum sp. alder98 TaxID=2913096 RepID=UPI001CD8CFA2|nr:filamentous hemagglutinin N-terminal domain-containing protein [Herbaspirillum sp. alder98]MCA1324511.1 filamentous hemagglutinin N-terminal domain-containing protein [Herbaspirillum sp. alder98]